MGRLLDNQRQVLNLQYIFSFFDKIFSKLSFIYFYFFTISYNIFINITFTYPLKMGIINLGQ